MAADLALPHIQSGQHIPTELGGVAYGPDALSSLPAFLSQLDIAADSPIFILTGRSLSTSPLLDLVKAQLGQRLAGVFSSIGQHTPVEGIRRALEEVERTGATAIVGFGGGSVIDAAKAVSFFHHEQHGRYLPQVALPTTLSAAELTVNAGYTNDSGDKVAVRGAKLAPKVSTRSSAVFGIYPRWLGRGTIADGVALECSSSFTTQFSPRPRPKRCGFQREFEPWIMPSRTSTGEAVLLPFASRARLTQFYSALPLPPSLARWPSHPCGRCSPTSPSRASSLRTSTCGQLCKLPLGRVSETYA